MEMTLAINMLQSLAQDSRFQVFRLLVRAGIPGPTLSFHLNHLVAAGVVIRTRNGRSLRYAICFQQLQELFTYLMEDCCNGVLRGDDSPQACCTKLEETLHGTGQ